MSQETEKPKYKLVQSHFFNLGQKILNTSNRFLGAFNLTQSQHYWGIVYDSSSKQPLDPVIVKLLYVDGKEVETCVTDLSGRYGFLARPGKFKLFARKTNYNFPSTKVLGDRDGSYENLYHGEFFVLQESSEVVAPNIPMDPANFDWNQKAKQTLVKKHPTLKIFFKRLMGLLFWSGFLLCGYLFWQNFSHPPLWLYIVAGAYLVCLYLAAAATEIRLWGRLRVGSTGEYPEKLFLELHNPKFPEIIFGQAKIRDDGKFLLRANKGRYLLYVRRAGDPEILAALGVSISSTGVFSPNLFLKR